MCSHNAFRSVHTQREAAWKNPTLTVKSNKSPLCWTLPPSCTRLPSLCIACSSCLPLSTSIQKATWLTQLQKLPRKPTNKYSGEDSSLVFTLAKDYSKRNDFPHRRSLKSVQDSNRCLINAKPWSQRSRTPAVRSTCPLPRGSLQRCRNLPTARWWSPAAPSPAAGPVLPPRCSPISAACWSSASIPGRVRLPFALKQGIQRTCWHSTISLLVSREDGRLRCNFPPCPSVFRTFTCRNQQPFPSLPLLQKRQMSSERSEKHCFILTNVAAQNRIVGINSNCANFFLKKKIFSVKHLHQGLPCTGK